MEVITEVAAKCARHSLANRYPIRCALGQRTKALSFHHIDDLGRNLQDNLEPLKIALTFFASFASFIRANVLIVASRTSKKQEGTTLPAMAAWNRSRIRRRTSAPLLLESGSQETEYVINRCANARR
jgi:hypothetical protein